MYGLLPSAEYSKLTSAEQHSCETVRAQRTEAFDPWSGRFYPLVLYHWCRRVWSDCPATYTGRTELRTDMWACEGARHDLA